MTRVRIERGAAPLVPLDAAKLARKFKCRTPDRMAFVAYGSVSASCGGCAAYCGGPRAGWFAEPVAVPKQGELL